MKRLSWLLLFLFAIPVHAQYPWSGILSASRALDWSTAGIPGGIPVGTQSGSTITSTGSDQTSAIQTAINTCSAAGSVGNEKFVQLAAGTFTINGVLQVKNFCYLNGAGGNQTIFSIHSTAGTSVIQLGTATSASGPNISGDVSITSGTAAGSSSIVVSSASGVVAGTTYLRISELNDSSFVSIQGDFGTCNFCDGGFGYNGTRVRNQISLVTNVSGTTLTISPPLMLGYTHTPLATPFTMTAQYAGVENLQIYSNNTGAGDNIHMGMCAYCFVSGVEGNYTDGDHVTTDFAYHGMIVNSYFSNAQLHTSGTYDSCIAIRNSTTYTLVQNNILERLHLSVVAEWGGGGNVISYNYLFGNFDNYSYNFMSSDLNTHGAHPQLNLYEGNIGAALNFDSGWGSGSDLTTFRNWSKGTTLLCNPQTVGRAVVVCSPNYPTSGYYAFQENNAFLFGFLNSNLNQVGDVAGSTQVAALCLNGSNPGATCGTGGLSAIMPQIDTVQAICGTSPCGNVKPYGEQSTDWAYGFGESNDAGDSSTANSNCSAVGTGNNPAGYCDSATPYSTRFFHGEVNSVANTITWAAGVTHSLPPSFYLSSKPAWMGSVPWPGIGPDITGGIAPNGYAYANSAEYCYEHYMGGSATTPGVGSPLAFNASTCYPTSVTPPPVPNPVSIIGLTSAQLPTGGTQQFTATCQTMPCPTLSWKTTIGIITGNGLLTAPASAGSGTVSVADSTNTATFPVTVFATTTTASGGQCPYTETFSVPQTRTITVSGCNGTTCSCK